MEFLSQLPWWILHHTIGYAIVCSVEVGDWGHSYSYVLRTSGDLFGYERSKWYEFKDLSEEKQAECLKRMISHVKRLQRETWYKKWVYALSQTGEEHRIPIFDLPEEPSIVDNLFTEPVGGGVSLLDAFGCGDSNLPGADEEGERDMWTLPDRFIGNMLRERLAEEKYNEDHISTTYCAIPPEVLKIQSHSMQRFYLRRSGL